MSERSLLEIPIVARLYSLNGRRRASVDLRGAGQALVRLEDAQALVLADRAQAQVDGWISVKDRLPDMDVPVFALEGDCIVFRVRSSDSDAWYWCNPYSSMYHDGSRWKCDDSEMDDDYAPTHWRPLAAAPQPPEPKP